MSKLRGIEGVDNLTEWAEDHGYSRYRCRQHGGFWSDTGAVCPYCPDDGRTGNAREDSRNAARILAANKSVADPDELC